MCAIVGFNSVNKNNILERMLDTVNHRGPDDRGIYKDDFVSLGHNRLSILDLSNHGHQPMIFEDLVIIYNGEVYNFQDIKQELVLLGYKFFSDTDTEVVLKAYHKWGIKAVDKFIGMFAIVIYNKTKQEIILIRDRAGVKPLYYFNDDDKFVFASELKPIMLYIDNLSINSHSLQEYFQLGFIPHNLTIFNNAFKLPAGSFGVFSLKNRKLTIEQYWSIVPYFDKPKFQKTETELIDELENLLISACMYRTVSDVPIGVFLSGGVDSAIIAAILQKHYGNIRTFTIGIKEKSYNESKDAKKIANHIGSIHTERILDVKEAGKVLENYAQVYDEPLSISGGISGIFVSTLAKENNIKVVLVGDGGDEIFCGYDSYYNNYIIGKQVFKLPFLIRKLLAMVSIKYLKKIIKIKGLRNRYSQLDKTIKASFKAKNWQDLHVRAQYAYNTKKVKKLLINNKKLHAFFKAPKHLHPIEQMMLHDYHIPLVDNILAATDRATMSVSIEGREPLMDHRIAEFMAQVPIRTKYKADNKKYLLKKVLARYLPESMIDKPKRGFGIPMLEWFGGELSCIFGEYFQQYKLKQHNFLNTTYIQRQHERLLLKKHINVSNLWQILVYQMWYEKYMANYNTPTIRSKNNSPELSNTKNSV
jgi:asparagine synthase (glutamine-hydrolysing)